MDALLCELFSGFDVTLESLKDLCGVVRASGMNQSIGSIKAFLCDLGILVPATCHDEEVEQFLDRCVRGESACLLNDLWQGDPVESFAAFEIVLVTSVLESRKIQLLYNYDL